MTDIRTMPACEIGKRLLHDDYDWERDSFLTYDLYIQVRREVGVRERKFKPCSADEMRRFNEGPVAGADLDCVRKRQRRTQHPNTESRP